MADYYLAASPTGSDTTGDGSSDSPWETVTKAHTVAGSGDTIYFRSQDTWTTSSGAYIDAITGVTYDGSSWGSGSRATIQATGGFSYAVIEVDVSNVTVTGFEVDCNNQQTGGIHIAHGSSGNTSGVTINDCYIHDIDSSSGYHYALYVGPYTGNKTVSNTAITNNIIYNVGHEGIALYPSWTQPGNLQTTTLVRGNTITYTGQDGSSFAEGILVSGGVTDSIIEFNYVGNSNGRGANIDTPASGSFTSADNLTYRFNIFKDNASYGLHIFGRQGGLSGTFQVYGNLFINNGNLANIYVGPGEFNSSAVNIYNNVFYRSATDGQGNVMINHYNPVLTGSPTINFKNNLIFSAGNIPLYDDNSLISAHSNNLIYRSSGASDTHVYNGTTYNRSGVLTFEPSAQNTDPSFTGGTLPTGFSGTYGTNMVPNQSYFSVDESSSAVGNGIDLGSTYSLSINSAGTSTQISRGTIWDIGAYELIADNSISVSPGIIAVTGVAVVTTKSGRVIADCGDFTLAGIDATTRVGATASVGHPSGDVTTTGWSVVPSGDFYATLDEVFTNDDDYCYTNLSAAVLEVRLSGTKLPNTGVGHVLSYRGRGNYTVSLRQGSDTEIASWQESDIALTTHERTLSEAQAESITDYTDLRVRIVSS